MSLIKISTDFSVSPGARYYTDGPNSGEEFFDKILDSKFNESLERKEKLTVNLDGTSGYAPSFLSEAFGLLSEKHNAKIVLNNIDIISNEEPKWKIRILDDFIPNASQRKKKESNLLKP